MRSPRRIPVISTTFRRARHNGTHLAAVIFDQLAGIKTTHVPYKGGAQGLADLLSGQVQFAFSTIGLVAPHVDTGRLRFIAVGSAKRYSRLPALPTVAESGVSGYEAEQWYGVVAPAGTSPAIINKLAREITRHRSATRNQRAVLQSGHRTRKRDAEQFALYIKTTVTEYAKIIADLGLKTD